MKISKVSKNFVKVRLSSIECSEFDITADGTPLSPRDLQGFLSEIMSEVHLATGFNPFEDGQVIVEARRDSEGMTLAIIRLGKNGGKCKMSRDDFKKLCEKKAMRPLTEEEKLKVGTNAAVRSQQLMRSFENTLGEILESLKPTLRRNARIRSQRRNTTTFVFDSFVITENALCHLPDEIAKTCELFRRESHYALIGKIAYNSKLYNTLSEYAAVVHNGIVLPEDIREGWTHVAKYDTLIEMIRHMREMR